MSDRVCLLNEGKIEQIGNSVEIYTSPRTKFAASFIGHYNVLDADQFYRAFGGEAGKKAMIAIRPETIQLSHEKQNHEDSYEVQGKIIESRSVGSVLRYHVDLNGINVRVDTLFRSFFLFENGSDIWVSLEKRNCLKLED